VDDPGDVILRLIRGRARPDEVDAWCAAVSEKLGPSAHAVGGPTRFHCATRPAGGDLEALIISFWDTFEAAADADARGISALSIARSMLLRVEATHFEIDETILRNSDVEPIALRLGIGRFSKPGSDIEMLETLRQRVPLIGDEMTEAYVGRRVVDRSVEVAFVSAWRRFPTDRVLDTTFWPDIALRYDAFTVQVYTTMGIPGT
jgi:hypothetical protein